MATKVIDEENTKHPFKRPILERLSRLYLPSHLVSEPIAVPKNESCTLDIMLRSFSHPQRGGGGRPNCDDHSCQEN